MIPGEHRSEKGRIFGCCLRGFDYSFQQTTMKKAISLTVFMAFAAMSISMAQDADKILDKHFRAIGQDKLSKIKTIDARGSASMMGMSTGIHMMAKRPHKLRMVIELQGMEIITGYDGKTAWTMNPMTGSSVPVAMSGAEADGFMESADMDGKLWNYAQKGHKVELVGEEDVHGKASYVLKLTKAGGDDEKYYIDKESYLIVMVKATAPVNGAAMEVEAHMSDYKRIEGYMMPMSTTQKVGGQTIMSWTFDEVRFNTNLDDALFSME